VRVDDHTIEVAQGPLFYRSAPGEGTPVLYLHGVPTSSDDWTEFLERTGGLAPDLPGFGRTGKGGHLDYSIGGYADFIERFLEYEGVNRIKLVAHDWGAAGGLAFAQRQPERVERIVLIAPVPMLAPDPAGAAGWPAHARAWRRPIIGELAMGFTNRFVLSRALRRASAREQAFSDERLRAIWEQFDQGTQRAILRLHRAAGEAQLGEVGARLSELGMPVMIVWGERDPWRPAQLADAYAARLPDATVAKIPAAGHWPWLGNPALVERVASFLESS
jgi:pimeloyl-ACP methyl ester carboxylesterase